jgi:hypothetical protein
MLLGVPRARARHCRSLTRGHHARRSSAGRASSACVALLASAVGCLLSIPASGLKAQTEYHDLDAGRPTRIEDAQVTPRQAIEWEMAPIEAEQFSNGLTRYTIEPALSYGVLPRTDIELTAPFIFRERGATPSHGLTGFGVGAMYSFNNETTVLPSLALKGEVVFPAAGATTSGTLYAARAMATRTFGGLRLHLNVEFSSYHVAAPAPTPPCVKGCPFEPPPLPDSPCSVAPDQPVASVSAIEASAVSQTPARSASFVGPFRPPDTVSTAQTGGNATVIGIAADHAVPLRSLLVVGDMYTVQYSGGLPRPSDWTAELGFRQQISPRLVLDAGLGRRFLGLRPEWLATLGTTYTFAIPALIPEARPGAPR